MASSSRTPVARRPSSCGRTPWTARTMPALATNARPAWYTNASAVVEAAGAPRREREGHRLREHDHDDEELYQADQSRPGAGKCQQGDEQHGREAIRTRSEPVPASTGTGESRGAATRRPRTTTRSVPPPRHESSRRSRSSAQPCTYFYPCVFAAERVSRTRSPSITVGGFSLRGARGGSARSLRRGSRPTGGRPRRTSRRRLRRRRLRPRRRSSQRRSATRRSGLRAERRSRLTSASPATTSATERSQAARRDVEIGEVEAEVEQLGELVEDRARRLGVRRRRDVVRHRRPDRCRREAELGAPRRAARRRCPVGPS